MMHTIGLHHVFAPIALSVYPICIMCFMKTRELLLLLALTATTGMQAQRIKGSDTVLPIAQQTAERFMTLTLCPCHRDRRRNRCRYFSPAGPDHGHRHGFPRHQVQRKDEGQSRRRRLGGSSHRLRCPCRSGPPLQPSETTEPANNWKISSGKVTNWQQVGGDDRKIVVYSRETSSVPTSSSRKAY